MKYTDQEHNLRVIDLEFTSCTQCSVEVARDEIKCWNCYSYLEPDEDEIRIPLQRGIE